MPFVTWSSGVPARSRASTSQMRWTSPPRKPDSRGGITPAATSWRIRSGRHPVSSASSASLRLLGTIYASVETYTFRERGPSNSQKKIPW